MQAIPIASLGATGSYRDVSGHTASGAPDGYLYRQYQDGTIIILQSPQGSHNVTVTSTGSPTAWAAITKQIGAYPSGRLSADQWTQIVTSTANAASAALQAVTAGNRTQGQGHHAPRSAPASAPPPVSPPSSMPGWVAPSLLVVTAATVLYLLTSKGHAP